MSLSIHDQVRRTVLTDAFKALRTIMDETREECIDIIEEISGTSFLPPKVGISSITSVLDTSSSAWKDDQKNDEAVSIETHSHGFVTQVTPSMSERKVDDQQVTKEMVDDPNITDMKNDPLSVSPVAPCQDSTIDSIGRIAEVLRGMIKRVYGLQISALPILQLKLLACLLGLLKRQKENTRKVSTNISKAALVVRLEAYHCEKNPLGKRQRKSSSDNLELDAQFLSIRPKVKKEPKVSVHKNGPEQDASSKAGKEVTDMKSIISKISLGRKQRKSSSDNLELEAQFLSIRPKVKKEPKVSLHKNGPEQDASSKAGKEVTDMKSIGLPESRINVGSTVLSAADLLSHYFTAPSATGIKMYSVVDELVSDDDVIDSVSTVSSRKADTEDSHSELVVSSDRRFAHSSNRHSHSNCPTFADAEEAAVLAPEVTLFPIVSSSDAGPPQGHDIIFNALRMGEPLVLELAAELLLKQRDTLDGTVTTPKEANVLARQIFDYLLKRNVAVEEHKTLFILG